MLEHLAKRLGRVVNRAFTPLGIEIRRRQFEQSRGKATLWSALRCLHHAGFRPATVLDVGVAQGTDALYHTFPTAHHVLVEPLSEFIPHLERIVRGLPDAEYVLAAAGREDGTTVLHFGRHLEVTSTRHLTDRRFAIDQGRTVPCVTLDEIWATKRLAGPALLKIDTEGAELDVIAGARTMLASCACLVAEVSFQELFQGAPRVEAVIERLASLGFFLFDVVGAAYHTNGRLVTADVVMVDRAWL
jgi:FkbM family methyltransferase